MPNIVKHKRCRVELHVHLDGSVRHETIIDLARKRGIKLPVQTSEELKEYLMPKGGCGSLEKFLAYFAIFCPCFAGDRDAIKRIAYEFCEDSANDGIIYSEARYCPHLLENTAEKPIYAPNRGDISPREVVQLVNEGLKKGQEDFDITVRSILTCIKFKPEWSEEILQLCDEFRDDGVVGIDIAGNEYLPMDPEHIRVFVEAEKLGIRRTVHAGENGTYKNVKEAVFDMHAERIGHGYHVVDDEKVYEQIKKRNTHFEVCPLSSFTTGSVDEDPRKHPVIRFAKDNVNFSINSDDPTMTGRFLSGDYEIVTEKIGLTEEQVLKAEYNAALSSFLPEEEKKQLINRMRKEFAKWTHILDSGQMKTS